MAGVSPDSIELLRSKLNAENESFDESFTYDIEGYSCTYPSDAGILGSVCRVLIDERNKVGKYTVLGNSLKFEAKSIYEMMASRFSTNESILSLHCILYHWYW